MQSIINELHDKDNKTKNIELEIEELKRIMCCLKKIKLNRTIAFSTYGIAIILIINTICSGILGTLTATTALLGLVYSPLTLFVVGSINFVAANKENKKINISKVLNIDTIKNMIAQKEKDLVELNHKFGSQNINLDSIKLEELENELLKLNQAISNYEIDLIKSGKTKLSNLESTNNSIIEAFFGESLDNYYEELKPGMQKVKTNNPNQNV